MINVNEDDLSYSWTFITIEQHNCPYVRLISNPRTPRLLVNSWFVWYFSLIAIIDKQGFILSWWYHPPNCSYYCKWANLKSKFLDKEFSTIYHFLWESTPTLHWVFLLTTITHFFNWFGGWFERSHHVCNCGSMRGPNICICDHVDMHPGTFV